jgi:hypothetical protein
LLLDKTPVPARLLLRYLAALADNHVNAAARQVVGGRAASNAPADDHNVGDTRDFS